MRRYADIYIYIGSFQTRIGVNIFTDYVQKFCRKPDQAAEYFKMNSLYFLITILAKPTLIPQKRVSKLC